jgi:hypothetical protein
MRKKRGDPIAEMDRHSKEAQVKSRGEMMMPFHATHKRAQPSANVVISRHAFKQISQLGLVGHDELFVRAGHLVHAARGQNVEEWDKWDKPEARPPIPLYERPEALIYQAKEPPVAAVGRNASCEHGRVDAWTRNFSV